MTSGGQSKSARFGGIIFLVISVAVCTFSCVYVTYVWSEIRVLRDEIASLSLQNPTLPEVYEVEGHSLEKRSLKAPTAEDTSNRQVSKISNKAAQRKAIKAKRKKTKKRRKCCRKGKRGPKGPKGDVGPRGPSGPRGKGIQHAAHFATDFWRDVNISEFGGDLSNKCINKWKGSICRNRTFTSQGDDETMMFFNPVPWMAGIDSPLEVIAPGGQYKALKAGLYLVYLHVVFYDTIPREGVSIVQKRSHASPRDMKPDTILQCMEGNKIARGIQNIKFKTCSITSMLHINQNDTLEIKSMYRSTVIDLSKDFTYFGAILLAEQNSSV